MLYYVQSEVSVIKINYQKFLNEKIEQIKKEGKKPSLLLHACCAPCSSAVLEKIKDFFNITILFYNPNISPESEYNFRLLELKRLLNEMGLGSIKVIDLPYNNNDFEAIAKGKENLLEGGERCFNCYRLRLEKTAEIAKEKHFDFFCTTLSVSPHKNAERLNEIGLELEKTYNVPYLCSDFKKNEGYKRSCELSRVYNLYRQNYCGCVYSKRET